MLCVVWSLKPCVRPASQSLSLSAPPPIHLLPFVFPPPQYDTRHNKMWLLKVSTIGLLLFQLMLVRRVATATFSTAATRMEANGTFLYFAYGSNLLEKRIHIQNPTAVRKGIGKLMVSRVGGRPPVLTGWKWNEEACDFVVIQKIIKIDYWESDQTCSGWYCENSPVIDLRTPSVVCSWVSLLLLLLNSTMQRWPWL